MQWATAGYQRGADWQYEIKLEGYRCIACVLMNAQLDQQADDLSAPANRSVTTPMQL